MIWVTDALNNGKVALNEKHIVAVFEMKEGEHVGKTAINLVNGSIIVSETDIEVVGQLQGN